MKIYIDESGTFVDTSQMNSWNCVAALCVPAPARRAVEKAVQELNPSRRAVKNIELKLRDISEEQYASFLKSLAQTQVSLFVVAIDSGREDMKQVVGHKNYHEKKLTKQIPKMMHRRGRQGLTRLRDQIRNMPEQLYVQMYCQAELFEDIIRRTVLHYAQVCPGALKAFRWRIDQKGSSKTDFEAAFERTVPPLLQEKTLQEPIIVLEGKYRNLLSNFDFSTGSVPRWHVSENDVPDDETLDVTKLILGDLEFCDSKASVGIQAADLLASGIRRTLRGNFSENEMIAELMGRLMLNAFKGKGSVRAISFTPNESCSGHAAKMLHIMNSSSKPTLQ